MKQYIKKEFIQIITEKVSYQEAIELSCSKLLEEDYITSNYSQEIRNNIEKEGAYIVLTDGLAIPHARPEQGSLKTGIAITLFSHPVSFPDNKKAALFITISAQNNDIHLDMLQWISVMFYNTDKLTTILKQTQIDEIYKIFQT